MTKSTIGRMYAYTHRGHTKDPVESSILVAAVAQWLMAVAPARMAIRTPLRPPLTPTTQIDNRQIGGTPEKYIGNGHPFRSHHDDLLKLRRAEKFGS